MLHLGAKGRLEAGADAHLVVFPDAVVDQHFAERGRIGRLVSAISQNPRHLGVGIDEDKKKKSA